MAAIEAVLYRFHETALDACVHDETEITPRNCVRCVSPRARLFHCLWLCLGLAATCLILLIGLDTAYEGNAGCFGAALDDIMAAAPNPNGTLPTREDFFKKDVAFRIQVKGDYVIDMGQDDGPFAPSYVFAGVSEVVTMGQNARTTHNYTHYNITLGVSCNAGWSPFDFLFTTGLVDHETVVINGAMWALPHREGYFLSARSMEAWTWPAPVSLLTDVWGRRGGPGGFYAFSTRFGQVFTMALGYALTSVTCALLVRVAIVLGPALLVPLLGCATCAFRGGRSMFLTPRELGGAYPWVGHAITETVAAGGSVREVLLAQGASLLLALFAFEALALGLGSTPWNWKSLPALTTTAVWSLQLMIEMAAYAHLRCSWSLRVVPLLHALVFFVFAAYYIAAPCACGGGGCLPKPHSSIGSGSHPTSPLQTASPALRWWYTH